MTTYWYIPTADELNRWDPIPCPPAPAPMSCGCIAGECRCLREASEIRYQAESMASTIKEHDLLISFYELHGYLPS